MKTASWVLLALAGVLTLLFSLLSAERAYGTYNDHIGDGVSDATSHGWRGLSARGRASAARTSERLGLNGGMCCSKVLLPPWAPPPNKRLRRSARRRP